MSVPQVSEMLQYVTPDGRLTLEGMKLFRTFLKEMRDINTTIDDHETRITALEP